MNAFPNKISIGKYLTVGFLIIVLLLFIFVGATLFPKEKINVTTYYDATLTAGEYTFCVSDAKYDTKTGEIRVNLYHMKAEPDMPENNYFLLFFQDEDKNMELSYTAEDLDAQNTVFIITGASSSWSSVSISILTNDYEGDPDPVTVTIDKRDMKEYDSSQIVYVYVTPTPSATGNE